MKRFVLVSITLLFSFAMALWLTNPVMAQFGILEKAKEAVEGGDSGKKGDGPAKEEAASGESAPSTAPMTYTNKAKHFSFTIPAGWTKVSGDPESDSAVFRKAGTSQHFQFHFTPMSKDFPAESSVVASLKTAKEDIELGKNESAKRRDDVSPDDKKKLYARGWELIDSGKGGIKRIIWQCYDRNNVYYNFMASSDTNEFEGARAMLQQVIDSIKFSD